MLSPLVFTLLIPALLGAVHVAPDPHFAPIVENSEDGSPNFKITFPSGHQDITVLSKFYSNEEDKLARKEHCNYVGHLAESPDSLIAMTGCFGQEKVAITLLSKHVVGSPMFDLYPNGTIQQVMLQLPFMDKISNDQDEKRNLHFDRSSTKKYVTLPSSIRLDIRVGYDNVFKNLHGAVEGEKIIEEGLAHCSVLFAGGGLGTKVIINRMGPIKHYNKDLSALDEDTFDSMSGTTAAELKGAQLMAYVTDNGGSWVKGSANGRVFCSYKQFGKMLSINHFEKGNSHRNGQILSHEIGHNIGLDHDNGDGRYGCQLGIMTTNKVEPGQFWSDCSKKDFQFSMDWIYMHGRWGCLTHGQEVNLPTDEELKDWCENVWLPYADLDGSGLECEDLIDWGVFGVNSWR